MSKKKKDEELRAVPEEDADSAAKEGGEGGEGEGEGDGKKGSKKKLIIIVAAVLILLIGGGAGLYFSGMLDGLLNKGEAVEGEAEAGKEGEKADAHGEKKGGHAEKKSGHGEKSGGHGEEGGDASAFFLQIPDMLVNLSSTDGQNRYLRLSVQLELGSDADKAAVEAVMPRVVDQFQTYLRELRVKDLRGSAGIYRLQMELLNRVNTAAYPVEVKDVLFQEILIQ